MVQSEAATPPTRAERKVNVAPEVVVAPEPNPIDLSCRPITAAELQQMRSYCDDRISRLAGNLERALEDELVDESILLAKMSARQAPADTQVKLLQAIKKGSAAQAQILYNSIVNDPTQATAMYGKVELQGLVDEVIDAAEDGALAESDLSKLQRQIKKLHLGGAVQTKVNQCLGDLAGYVKVREALGRAIAGQPSAKVSLPAGSIPVITCPNLTAGAWRRVADGRQRRSRRNGDQIRQRR